MGMAEIGGRASRALSSSLELALGDRSAIAPTPSKLAFGNAWVKSMPLETHADSACLSQANSLLAGRWQIFSLQDQELGFPPNWNRDPSTGVVAPSAFGKMIDYRNEALVGNIKYLWEPSRHLELVTLAQAWRTTRDSKYIDACALLLTSWFDQCPYPMGAHWASALEAAVRLLNWSVAWHMLGGEKAPFFDGERGAVLLQRWLGQIYFHQRFIAGYLSKHSSANNHLLGELMGLFIAAVTWPCWPESPRWGAMGREGFEREALQQNWEDGVNKEQGIYYHHEVADMMLWVGLYGRANGHHFSDSYWTRLESMLAFIDALMDSGNHVPMIGDADDALMVRLDPRECFDPFVSLLHTGSELFARPQWRRSPDSDPKTSWLLGAGTGSGTRSMPLAESAAKRSERTRVFPNGGYWVLGSDFGTPEEVHLVADAGPLGYLSIAAHGHADALAIVLSLGGQPVLVDPGTYAYHTQKKWRDYFRGTSAHNTLRIDGLDQSVIGGNFMWLDKAEAKCLHHLSDDCGDDWLAEHDGYTRLLNPVTHQRRVQYFRRDRTIRVTDGVNCSGPHTLEWHWHFAPGCKIDVLPQGGLVTIDGWAVYLRLDAPGLEFTLHQGQTAPPLGWVSRRFDHKEPSPSLRCRGVVEGSSQFVTEFQIKRIDTGNRKPS